MKNKKLTARNIKTIFTSKDRSRLYPLLFVMAFALVGLALLLKSFAATGQIYLLASSSSLEVNQEVTVNVRINPGTGVFGVQKVIVTYDATKLQYVSNNSIGSPFESQLVAPILTPGSIEFNRATFGADITTDALIANITFKALAGSGSASLQVTGNAEGAAGPTNPTGGSVAINFTSQPIASNSATYIIEPTTLSPTVGNQFGLKVYVDSSANIQGGEVKVNLPTGLAYQGTLDTTGTAFNPATTVTGTTPQFVYLVFATQATTLTGKQLVATIPVKASSVGAMTVTFTGQRVIDINNVEIATTANPYVTTIGSTIVVPTLSLTGGAVLGTSVDITNLKQSFTITNYDSTLSYAVFVGGQALTVGTDGKFSLPASLPNGNHILQVSLTSAGVQFKDVLISQIRLRSPNVNRTGCVELLDLLAVNKVYGTTTTEFDLNFDGTVSLFDLLTVTAKWGGECV